MKKRFRPQVPGHSEHGRWSLGDERKAVIVRAARAAQAGAQPLSQGLGETVRRSTPSRGRQRGPLSPSTARRSGTSARRRRY